MCVLFIYLMENVLHFLKNDDIIKCVIVLLAW